MEMLYQYLWKFRMLGRELHTVDGEEVEILSPGVLNRDAGPDFSHARLRIAGQEWIGNVEIHVRASDWLRHGHDSDRAYDSVILHLVSVSDCRIPRPDGTLVPQVVASFPESFFRMYLKLSGRISRVACEEDLGRLSSLTVADWMSSLSVERLQMKSGRILRIYEACGRDWETTCFITLARSLGFGLNGEPFEMLARSVPLRFLARHCDDPMQIEALLFGQAGMLDTSLHIFDEYYQLLCREYYFLARKYGLRPMRRELWKYSRTRPWNFPHRRIAFLAVAVSGGFALFSDIMERSCDPGKIAALFHWTLRGYWATHTDFDVEGAGGPASLSEASIRLLLINFAAPLIYAHAASLGDADIAERASRIWDTAPPEKNSIISQWRNAGITAKSAADSQALLQLRREYCDRDRCLECRFGHALLRNSCDL